MYLCVNDYTYFSKNLEFITNQIASLLRLINEDTSGEKRDVVIVVFQCKWLFICTFFLELKKKKFMYRKNLRYDNVDNLILFSVKWDHVEKIT